MAAVNLTIFISSALDMIQWFPDLTGDEQTEAGERRG